MHRIQPTRRLFPVVLAGLLLLLSRTVVGATCLQLPSDAISACTVPGQLFASWFENGTVAPNGVVNPADSVNFPDIANCTFYQWSEQMYLWVTSPAPAAYGGSGRIFESPAFYDVSPLLNGSRTLTAHTQGASNVFSLRQAQVGPHSLPVVMVTKGFRKTGRMVEIALPRPGQTGYRRCARGVSCWRLPLWHYPGVNRSSWIRSGR